MKWYSVKIIVECNVVGSSGPSLCEEQIHVILAKNAESAYRKAMRCGEAENHEYENSEGEIVCWVFKGLGDLVELCINDIVSGSEVWSTLHHEVSAKDLVIDKKDLTVFAMLPHNKTKAKDLLTDKVKPFAPK
jgi:hypothetical protein